LQFYSRKQKMTRKQPDQKKKNMKRKKGKKIKKIAEYIKKFLKKKQGEGISGGLIILVVFG